MKKTFNIYAVCWAVLLVVFNLVAFLIPNEIMGTSKFSGNFWIGYAFITISFIGQLVCAYFAFKQESLKKFFYNASLISISYSATVLSVVVGILCMVLPFVPVWIGAIICVLILGFSAVSVLKAKAAVDIVGEVDEKIKVQTFFIDSLLMDAETLMARAKSGEIKEELKRVYEAVRYSDPMSSNALANVESQITVAFSELTEAITEGNAEAVKKLANELVILINDRNKKCKLLK